MKLTSKLPLFLLSTGCFLLQTVADTYISPDNVGVGRYKFQNFSSVRMGSKPQEPSIMKKVFNNIVKAVDLKVNTEPKRPIISTNTAQTLVPEVTATSHFELVLEPKVITLTEQSIETLLFTQTVTHTITGSVPQTTVLKTISPETTTVITTEPPVVVTSIVVPETTASELITEFDDIIEQRIQSIVEKLRLNVPSQEEAIVEVTSDIPTATSSSIGSTSSDPKVTPIETHGSGAKEILNMKPMPNKILVKPQFQRHDQNGSPVGNYAKPKIDWMNSPTVSADQYSTGHRTSIASKNTALAIANVEELLPLLKSLLQDHSVLSDTTNSAVLSSSEASRSPSISTVVEVEEEYVYKYVDQFGNEVAHPSEATSTSTSHDERGPFKTFKSKEELSENYRKQQFSQNEDNAKIEFPKFDMEPEFKDHSKHRSHRSHKLRDHRSRSSKNGSKFSFDIFGLRSSSSRLEITNWISPWAAFSLFLLITLM